MTKTAPENDKAQRSSQAIEYQKLEKYMRLLMESTQDPILLLDQESRIVYCSKSFRKLMGTPDVDKVTGRIVYDIYQDIGKEELSDGGKRRFQKIKSEKRPVSVNVDLCFPGRNELRQYTIQSTPMLDDSGSFDGVLVIYHDTTEMLEAEAEERTRLMLDATPLATSFWDEHGVILDCNLEALRMFGLARKSDYIGRFYELNPERQPDGAPSREKTASLIRAAFETGYQRFEWQFLTATGEPLPVETTLVRVPWKDGFRLASYSRDLRELKAKEEAVRTADEHSREVEVQARTAKAAASAKARFLASMSHEIRTPMNVILGMSELMRTDNLDEVQRRYFADIQKMSRSLLQIINDILDFSKIDAGKLDLIPGNYNIFALFENVCALTRFTIVDKPLEFHGDIAGDIPAVLYGDEVRVRQIVMNILSNAVKYTLKGHVALDVRRVTRDGREYLTVRVEDTGIGIRKEDFSRLFVAFEQADAENHRGIVGTGLGLAITKQLVDLMGGELGLESEYGKGSVFTVYLPLVAGDAGQAEAEKVGAARLAVATDAAKALVVDDSEINLTVALGFLARHGMTPDTASGGLQAVELVRAKRYDIVFMDHMMPEVDGLEATRRIRALGGDYYGKVPIIALTANAMSGAKESFLEAGMDDFLSKPISDAELNRVLLRWLPPEKLRQGGAMRPAAAPKPASALASPPEAGMKALLDRLAQIDDLDVAKGLARVEGDRTVYIDILRQFCKGAGKDVEAVRAFAGTGNWKDYAIRVHALKSVFANLGDRFLSDWAQELEKAAKRGDAGKCQAQTERFCAEMEKFHRRLLETSLMEEPRDPAKRRIARDTLLRRLKNLGAACLDCDTDKAGVITGMLKTVTFNREVDGKLKEIFALVESFDYDEAVARLAPLTKKLSA